MKAVQQLTCLTLGRPNGQAYYSELLDTTLISLAQPLNKLMENYWSYPLTLWPHPYRSVSVTLTHFVSLQVLCYHVLQTCGFFYLFQVSCKVY